MKKALPVLLALCLACCLCVPAFAEEDVQPLGEKTENGFTYAYFADGTAVITRYKGAAVNCDIPEKLGGNTVTAIGEGAFSGKRFLRSVTIPDTVERIENEAFGNCLELKHISFGNGLREIGWSAFYSDYALEEAILPDSLEKIGKQAFHFCHKLRNVSLGNSLNAIGTVAFGCCFSLREITIPPTVTEIPAGAFLYCYRLEKVNLPDGIVKIGQAAFQDCIRLKLDRLPASLETIEAQAFSCCFSLREVEVPDSVRSVDSSAFSGCLSTLTFVTTKGSYIENYAEGTFTVRYTDTGETIPMKNGMMHDVIQKLMFYANLFFYEIPGILFSKTVITLSLFPW